MVPSIFLSSNSTLCLTLAFWVSDVYHPWIARLLQRPSLFSSDTRSIANSIVLHHSECIKIHKTHKESIGTLCLIVTSTCYALQAISAAGEAYEKQWIRMNCDLQSRPLFKPYSLPCCEKMTRFSILKIDTDQSMRNGRWTTLRSHRK